MGKPILFFSWLRVQRLAAAVGLLGAGVSVLVFWLYGLPGEGLVYTLVLWAAGFSSGKSSVPARLRASSCLSAASRCCISDAPRVESARTFFRETSHLVRCAGRVYSREQGAALFAAP